MYVKFIGVLEQSVEQQPKEYDGRMSDASHRLVFRVRGSNGKAPYSVPVKLPLGHELCKLPVDGRYVVEGEVILYPAKGAAGASYVSFDPKTLKVSAAK